MNNKSSFFFPKVNSKNQNLKINDFFPCNATVILKREDLLHEYVSGNKFRKLKYNIQEANNLGYKCLLTFGGAFSNHIAAVAASAHAMGLSSIGIIRGEELSDKIKENPTLRFAQEQGMKLHFITREAYGQKTNEDFIISLKEKFGDFYLLPEGGTNELAVKGCEEILNKTDKDFDYICCPVGTGGTIAGLIHASDAKQTVLGFSALKGTFQKEIIETYSSKTNYHLTDAYCFGGYAKIDLELVRFINEFKNNSGIPLDPVYTGKMMFGIFDLLKKGYFKENCRILAVHTGGLQGISGMNQLLKKKNLPQIEL